MADNTQPDQNGWLEETVECPQCHEHVGISYLVEPEDGGDCVCFDCNHANKKDAQ